MGIKTWPEFKEDWKDLWSFRVWKKDGAKEWFKDLENLFDDYPDWVKEKIHGAHLPFGYEINFAFAMCNRPRPYWPLIRKQGDYDNEQEG